MKDEIFTVWRDAARAVADGAVKELNDTYELTPAQRLRADVLMRQYTCDRVCGHLWCAEGIDKDEGHDIGDSIRDELIREALAGPVSREGKGFSLFLYRSGRRVYRDGCFRALFDELLGPECPIGPGGRDSLSDGLMEIIDKRIKALEKRRTKERREREHPYDGPPMWMDEFEYIDWLISGGDDD